MNTEYDADDHPGFIVFNNISYEVRVDRNGDDEIQWFGLFLNGTNDLFFEMDWEGEFNSENIIQMLEEEFSSDDAPLEEAVDSYGGVGKDSEAVNKEKVAEFDFLYYDYESYPDEFKVQAVDDLRMFSDESQVFHNNLISEWADNWDEFGEF